MDNESLTIPITSAKGLLDISSKKSLNHLSQDIDFDQISFPHSPSATRLGVIFISSLPKKTTAKPKSINESRKV